MRIKSNFFKLYNTPLLEIDNHLENTLDLRSLSHQIAFTV